MSADGTARDRTPLDLAAVGADDAWVERLLRGDHADDDALAVVLAPWSDEVRAPVPPPREPVVPARRSTWGRRPRGARLVGLVASVGLIFATGVGQAVARDPAAPLRFVVDRGVSFGERLVGQPPTDDGAAPAAPRSGERSSRAAAERPGIVPGPDEQDTRDGDGPRPLPPSVLSPSPRTSDPTPDREEATAAPTRPTPLAPRGSSLPPSMAPRPTPTPSPTAGTPSASPSPSATPTRKPHHGVRPRPPSSGAAPSPVPTEDPGDPSQPSPPPADDQPPASSPTPTDQPSTDDTGSGG